MAKELDKNAFSEEAFKAIDNALANVYGGYAKSKYRNQVHTAVYLLADLAAGNIDTYTPAYYPDKGVKLMVRRHNTVAIDQTKYEHALNTIANAITEIVKGETNE